MGTRRRARPNRGKNSTAHFYKTTPRAPTIMVRASTLALHLNALQCALGLEILSMAHPRSAVFAFVPTILSGPLRGTVMQTVRSRAGEKWFAMAHGALAMNCLAFRGRVQNAFP